MANFTEHEKRRIKFHLGYPLQTTGVSIGFGIPISTQGMFLVESAVNKLDPDSEDMCRGYIQKLDETELMMFDGQINLAADQLEDLYLRKDYHPRLWDMYQHWQSRLAQVLGCSINADFSGIGQVFGGVRNVSVSG